jgi:hypothetical protein
MKEEVGGRGRREEERGVSFAGINPDQVQTV